MDDDRQDVRREQRGGVLTVTIDRPHRGNAIDGAAGEVLIDTFTALDRDPGDVRAVHLRSEGKHFCTGADIGGGSGDGDRERPRIGHMVRGLAHGAHRVIEAAWQCPIPIVAELTGRTSGMGLHLALCCDVTVTAASATFAEPFLARGFNVDSGGSWLLPRSIGLARAKQLLYRAEPIDAATALDWGLVTEVVDDADVEARAATVAVELAGAATYALATTKRLLHDHLDTDLGTALRDEAAAIELTIRSEDFKEGMRAFGQKRDPEFRGR